MEKEFLKKELEKILEKELPEKYYSAYTYDGSQTKFERLSNNKQIGIQANKKDKHLCFLILRGLFDNNWNYLKNSGETLENFGQEYEVIDNDEIEFTKIYTPKDLYALMD